MALLQPNQIPNLIMSVLQPDHNSKSYYFIVAATPKSRIGLCHCCSQKQKPKSDYGTLAANSKSKICCSQTQNPNLTMALLQPNRNPTSDYGIVAATPKSQIWLWRCCKPNQLPESDYGIVAAKPKTQIWLWQWCGRTPIPNLSMALLQPNQNLNVTMAVL